MQITLELPDDLAAHLLPHGKDPARAALEALALEGYRTHRLNEHQVRVMLGFQIRMQVHTFLADHNVPLHYTMEHLKQDLEASDKLSTQRTAHVAHAG